MSLSFTDGHTIEKMRVVWKKGFDQSKVTDNNYISLTQFEYAVFFEENYEEEIASGKSIAYQRMIKWYDVKHFFHSLPFDKTLAIERLSKQSLRYFFLMMILHPEHFIH